MSNRFSPWVGFWIIVFALLIGAGIVLLLAFIYQWGWNTYSADFLEGTRPVSYWTVVEVLVLVFGPISILKAFFRNSN